MPPDKSVHLRDVVRARHETRADRPDRLISDHQAFPSNPMRHRFFELAADDRQRLAGLALRLRLADADDGYEAGTQHRLRLPPHDIIAFAVIGAALGMADNNVGGAG